MVEYRLLFPEQYDIVKYVKDKQEGKEAWYCNLDEIGPYIEGMIKEIITDDMIEKNFLIKWDILNHSYSDKTLDRTDVCKKYENKNRKKNKGKKKGSSKITELKDLFEESKFFEIFGLPPRSKSIFEEITDNPKVCIALLKSELPDDFEWLCDDGLKTFYYQSIRFKLFLALKKGDRFVLNGAEKKIFLNMIFGKKVYCEELFQKEQREWEDFCNEVLPDIKIKNKTINDKNETAEDEVTIAEKTEDLAGDDSLDDIVISEYLSRFCYYMVNNKRYNPILHTKASDKKGYYYDQKKRKDTWEDMDKTEIALLCKCYIMKDYMKKKAGSTPKKLLKNYYSFVINYLKKLAKDSVKEDEKRLNLYLFEQVFGFGYINSVADMLQKKWERYKDEKFGDYLFEELGYFLGFVMEKFEPYMRTAIAEKIIDAYFYELFFNEDFRIQEMSYGLGIEDLEIEDRIKKRNEMYCTAMCKFLCSCREYIRKQELSVEPKPKGEWNKDVIDYKMYDEILNFKIDLKDERMDINGLTSKFYLSEVCNADKLECVEYILPYIKEVCWDYNVYGVYLNRPN